MQWNYANATFRAVDQWKSGAAPTTGTWAQGDVIYNSAPVSGGYAGFICTVAGTPGTWKTYGLIS